MPATSATTSVADSAASAAGFAPANHPRSTTSAVSDDHRLPVLGDEARVPLRDGAQVSYAALDYAASAPVLRRVWDAVGEFAPYYGSVHRSAGQLSRLSSEAYERSRATIAAFLGARADDALYVTRSTTESMNLLAAVLPSGTEVFVFESEHHAALLCWREHRTTVLPAPRSPEEAVATLERALARPSAGPRLVCVTGASNVTGEVWPIRRLAQVAHRHGARIALDAAQLAPHRRIDVAGWDVDWVALSGHKLYAPFGAGVLAGRADWPAQAEPYLAGGGASRAVTVVDGALQVEWQDGAARHEAGSPNVLGTVALAAACTALEEAGREELEAREQALTERLRTGLAAVSGVSVLALFGARADRVGVVSFTVRGLTSADVARELAERYGIGVRDGLFCAHPLVRALREGEPGQRAEPEQQGDGCGGPLGAVRASLGAGTPVEHVDRLLRAVRELAAEAG